MLRAFDKAACDLLGVIGIVALAIGVPANAQSTEDHERATYYRYDGLGLSLIHI